MHYIINAASRLKIYGLKGEFIKEIYIDPPGTLSNFNRFENELIFKYESFYIPYRVYKLDGWNLKLHILDEERVPDNYIIEDRWVKSYDGTSIHFFIFRKGDAELKNVIAYGYGGFGLGLTPRFYPHIIPLIEDGFVFTVANIRGGDEFGESWHKAGMRSNKNNVFKDFIAVIQYFKDMGSKVVAYGSSNGGLLVGGVLTIDPSLLDGAVIGYPVLDMLRFHKLYIGRAWIPEYGDPENPEDLEYLIKYSPYHNIREMGYPPTLVYTGLYDDRVHPSHAFKFVAKLKDHNAPVYLRTEKLSGHMGASPEVKVRELSEVVSFIYKVFESRAKDKE